MSITTAHKHCHRAMNKVRVALGVQDFTVAAQLGQSPETALKYLRRATSSDRARAVVLSGLGVPVQSNDCKVVRFDARRK